MKNRPGVMLTMLSEKKRKKACGHYIKETSTLGIKDFNKVCDERENRLLTRVWENKR